MGLANGQLIILSCHPRGGEAINRMNKLLSSKKITLTAWLLASMTLLMAGGCAHLSGGLEPPIVTVANLQPLPGQDFAPRFKVTLDLQNRNNQSIGIDGLDFDLEVNGRRFASGVSATAITLPALGQSRAEVEVTVNGLSLARQIFDWIQRPPDSLNYTISGHLHLQQGLRRRLGFSRDGQLDLNAKGQP